jgi:hypothetical protein
VKNSIAAVAKVASLATWTASTTASDYKYTIKAASDLSDDGFLQTGR